ncbi:ATPase [Bacilli bacterium]|nr:ATPase [Bacilli bacterium]
MTDKYTIKRHLENLIKETIRDFKILILTGSRQIGKTTILEKLLPKINNYKMITLDDKTINDYAISDPKGFLQQYNSPLFIDEIQKAKELFEYIKNIVDKNDNHGQYVLTGSQKFSLMKGVEEHLSTRAGIIDMCCLSQSEINGLDNFVFKPTIKEILKRKQDKITCIELFKRIIVGSMPDIVNGKVKNINTFYKTYTETMLISDLKEKITNKDISVFIRVLKALASTVGQEVNYSNIGKVCNIDRKKVAALIDYLLSINILFVLQGYSHNGLKRAVKSPKLYFYDTGLACYLMNYKDPVILNNSEYSGHIFECFAISEIVKGYINNGESPSVYYLTDSAHKQKEIDLIIEGDGGVLYPIEIKKNSTPKDKYFNNISMLKPLGNKIGAMTVICLCDDFLTFGEGKYFMPIH